MRTLITTYPYLDSIKEELIVGRGYQPVEKDILIVAHNQFNFVKNCIESIQHTTQDYHLYIWDNASDEETAAYLRSIEGADVERSEENLGFIIPNNRLVAKGKSPYVILLNTDVVLKQDWHQIMVGWLQAHPNVGAVSCLGGLLDEKMMGITGALGASIDYVAGWALCFPRKVYEQVGLFDETNLKFAYGEDSDFSLRLKEAGYGLYALACGDDIVKHWGNKTASEVYKVLQDKMAETFRVNHEYLQTRWKDYLRVLTLDLPDVFPKSPH